MRPLVALALAALLTASLAGCADDKERYPDGVPTQSTAPAPTQGPGGSATTTTTGSTTTTTSGPGGAENQAPTGSISVAVNGTNATFALSGSDPDEDPIVWDLDFGDGNATNGTSLPQTLNHTYAGGNFTANFTISDGSSPSTYSVPVTVGAGTSGGGAGATTQDAVAEYTVGQGFCGGTYPAQAAGTGTVFGEIMVEPGTYGKPFTASWAFAAPGSLGVQVIYKDAAGATVGDISNIMVTELTGDVPAGAVTAWFSDCGAGGPATVTYHAG